MITEYKILQSCDLQVLFSHLYSVLPTWKVLYQKTIILYSALSEHVKKSTRTEQLFLSRIRRFLVNLLGVLQRKLCSSGCHISLHVHQFWTALLDESYLKGCEKYMMGDTLGATSCWQVTYETSRRQEHQLGKSPTQDYHSHHQLQEKCLLAILYSSLISYNLSQALELANSTIESVSVDAKKLKVKRSFKQLLEDKTTVTLPIIKGPTRSVVMSLGRFMALYFTNKPLVVYMPPTDRALPVLFSESKGSPDIRKVAIQQHLIANNIHEQGISDLWTPDVALNLLLITGLFPEAIWFSKEVGDWKSAFTLSVIYRMKYDLLTADDSHRSHEELSLPSNLSALTLIQERLTALMEVSDSRPLHQLRRSARTPKGNIHKGLGMIENSESAAEEMTPVFSDILPGNKLMALLESQWLLGNILQQCLLTVSTLSCVVHEKYYLPAPPYYCPQPDYSPTDEDPDEVVQENASRR
ncbi:Protein JBTS17 [Holothuria leucospilota]|uniref:Protein JBTS17 n=1 Tax=Holothuria leucospilota TaxID=206669 RepID=A0A9Q1C9G1_HOLLE|nr:Protein JBTS17 [Holothuria leucospilota]